MPHTWNQVRHDHPLTFWKARLAATLQAGATRNETDEGATASDISSQAGTNFDEDRQGRCNLVAYQSTRERSVTTWQARQRAKGGAGTTETRQARKERSELKLRKVRLTIVFVEGTYNSPYSTRQVQSESHAEEGTTGYKHRWQVRTTGFTVKEGTIRISSIESFDCTGSEFKPTRFNRQKLT